ncbi:hypothetical protein [Nocardia xishanensis]
MDGPTADGRLDNYHSPRAAHDELLARVGASDARHFRRPPG